MAMRGASTRGFDDLAPLGHLSAPTQITRASQADTRIKHAAGKFEVFRYKEPKPQFAPFAGITEFAHWMTQKSLERLLNTLGFSKIKVVPQIEERNGLRLALVAAR